MPFIARDTNLFVKSMEKVLQLYCKATVWRFIDDVKEIDSSATKQEFCIFTKIKELLVMDLLAKGIESFELHTRFVTISLIFKPFEFRDSSTRSITAEVSKRVLHEQKNHPGDNPLWLSKLIHDILLPLVKLGFLLDKEVARLEELARAPTWNNYIIKYGVVPEIERIYKILGAKTKC
jgi:hypothetical protein